MNNPRRIKQMLTVLPEVRRWPGLLLPSEINQVAAFLGPIGDFKEIETNGCLVEALIHLWDPDCSAFRIRDKELTITIEEVAGLLNLPVERTTVIFPFVSGKAEFCHFAGLRESTLQGSDQSISVKFLFDRFADKDGFEKYSGDFTLASKAAWAHKRLWVYGYAMAGTYLFPREDKKISFKITKLISDLFFGIGGQMTSIVPTVLADIFTACTNCQRKTNFFHASNRILHIWAMEHFKSHSAIPNNLPLIGYNWIVTHHKRVEENNSMRTALECLDFLMTIPDRRIRWVLDWTDCIKAALHTKLADFIPLLGTQGIAAYTPKRFLRQLGRIQGLPPTPDLSDFLIIFDKGNCPTEIPRRSELMKAWESQCTDQNLPFDAKNRVTPVTTPQYEMWLNNQNTSTRQVVIDPAEEIARLRTLLEMKDRELIQAEQNSEKNKEAFESVKQLYTEAKQELREKKRKCLELKDNINHTMNRYSWEPDRSKAQRLEDQLKRVLDCIGELTE